MLETRQNYTLINLRAFAQSLMVTSAGRRKYVHVGFAAASLLQRPAEVTIKPWADKLIFNL